MAATTNLYTERAAVSNIIGTDIQTDRQTPMVLVGLPFIEEIAETGACMLSCERRLTVNA